MVRIYFKEGDGVHRHLLHNVVTDGILYLSDPIAVEEQYFIHTKIRTDGMGLLTIEPDRVTSILVSPSKYRLDRAWTAAREQEQTRMVQVWNMLKGGVPSPTIHQARGLARSASLTGREIAELVGTDDRTVRRWLSERERQSFPGAAWTVLLSRLGFVRISEV